VSLKLIEGGLCYGFLFRVAKRVSDAEGGVSQCGEQRSTEALAKPAAARPAGKRPNYQ
jgi:hypothetical protein